MELVNNDCLETMKALPEKSVDLFLCDLPYGCLKQEKGAIPFGRTTKGPSNSGCDWDIKLNLKEFWTQVRRLAKNDHTPVLMFCSTKFGFELYNSNPNWFRYDLIWSKPNAVGFLSANKMPMRSHESIYVFSKKGATYSRKDKDQKCVKSVFEFENKKAKGRHPTEKPVELYKFLIERYSKEGDTILDPTAGSFNSGVAAKELNRNYIGIELNKEFYEKGVELLKSSSD